MSGNLTRPYDFPSRTHANAPIPPQAPIQHSYSAIPCQPTSLSNSTLLNDTHIGGAITTTESSNIPQHQEFHTSYDASISPHHFPHNVEPASISTNIEIVTSSTDIIHDLLGNTGSPCNSYDSELSISSILTNPFVANNGCMDDVIAQDTNPYSPALSNPEVQASYFQSNIQYLIFQQTLNGENQLQTHYQQHHFISQEQSSGYSQQPCNHPQEFQWGAQQSLVQPQEQQNQQTYLLNDQGMDFTYDALYEVCSQAIANEEPLGWSTTQSNLSGLSPNDLMQVDAPEQAQRVCKRKREGDKSREAHTLEKKQKMIEYHQANPTVPAAKLGDMFDIPRTTVYGILDRKEKIERHLTKRPHSSRVTQSRFHILEELLAYWSKEQVCRGATLVYETYSAQAFEIHRMLSSLLEEPLPPHLFTTGWFKGFQGRYQQTILDATHGCQRISLDEEASEVLRAIRGKNPRDIYTCGGTSMYLDLMSDATFLEGKPEKPPHPSSSATVTVLLCTNATGSDRRDPLFLVRQSSAVTKRSGYVGTVLDTSLDDLPASILEKWLIDFDKSRKREVLLLLDEVLSKMLSRSKVARNLSRVTIVTVPNPLGAILPMSARLIKDFKIHYHTLLLQDSDAMAKYSALIREKRSIPELHLNGKANKSAPPPKICPLVSQSTQFERIHDAWHQVPRTVIVHHFEQFQDSLTRISIGCPSTNTYVSSASKAAEATLVQVLKYIYPDLKDTVSQYYKNLDKDMGPGHFLRMKIQEMQHSPDFQNCFVSNPCFGKLSVGIKSSKSNRMELVGQFDSVSRSSSFALYTCRNADQGSEELLVVSPPRACTF